MRDPREAATSELVDALREANDRLEEERHIFVSGPVCVFKWRNEEGWPVEYVSPNVAEVFGHSAEAFLSGEVLYADTIEPEDLARVGEEVADGSEGERSTFAHTPYRIRHRDGHVVWLLDYTTVLRDDSGAITHYLGYVIDVTEQQRVEEERELLQRQVMHAQKLESLGVLAGGIAHDFNNLLTGILANAQVLEEALAGRAPAVSGASVTGGEQSLEDVIGAALRARDLCTQMLAYSGKGRFAVDAYDLNTIVREMGHLTEASVSKSVRLRYELAPDLPPVEADATQLRQVILNLITNGAEAMDGEAGVVVVRTGLKTTEGITTVVGQGEQRIPAGEYVFLRVTDSGHGMDPETLTRIFDPFFTTKTAGRGLGLAVVLGIVRSHGGWIDVHTDPGTGSSMEILLHPSERPAVLIPQPPPYDASWRGSGTVLVVDDEDLVRRAAGRALEGAGFGVIPAESGDRALEIVRERSDDIDLVLLDLTMSGMGGLEVLAELRVLRPDLPVLLTSGYDEDDVASQLQRDRPDGFVQKPFLAQDLLAELQRVLGRSESASTPQPRSTPRKT